jgi:hypothetical protein
MPTVDTQNVIENEAKFNQLLASLQADPATLEKFTNNPTSFLESAGIPTVTTEQLDALSSAEDELTANAHSGISATKHWWGIDIKMDEQITNDIENGLTSVGPLGSLIAACLVNAGFVAGPIAAVVGAAIATAVIMKISEMKLADRHRKGVHWPISWPQWAAVMVNVSLGPPAILAALLIFIHPVSN